MATQEKPTGLALLRVQFPENQISYLPKGGVKLAYVGHAALTDRLLDADPSWNWEFAAANADGTPIIDKDGGFWIRLTVCGVTRLGYGDAQGKTGGNAMKERIGDALRNAAMRFGAALDLWHKGDLHADEPEEPAPLLLLTEKQVADIEAMADEANVSVSKIYGAAKVGSLAEIPAIAYDSIIKKLKASIIVAETSKEHQA